MRRFIPLFLIVALPLMLVGCVSMALTLDPDMWPTVIDELTSCRISKLR